MKYIITAKYRSPAGELILGALGDKLCLCDWTVNTEHRRLIDKALQRHTGASYMPGMSPVVQRAIAQLDEYFAATRRVFDIAVEITGTEFQRAVRSALLDIAYGTTISYAELARRIGAPKAVRAVAAANATNPLSLFLPCHRVIGSDNSLSGYSGGKRAKEFLLELEQRQPLKRGNNGA